MEVHNVLEISAEHGVSTSYDCMSENYHRAATAASQDGGFVEHEKSIANAWLLSAKYLAAQIQSERRRYSPDMA